MINVRALKKEELKYALGTLMYCPGDNKTIAQKIIENKYPDLNVLVLCLEDAILIQNLENATKQLEETLTEINGVYKANKNLRLPLIFIRVRTPEHLESCIKRFYRFKGLLSGFVMPKYDKTVSCEYKKIINTVSTYSNFLFMPILESAVLIETTDRRRDLLNLKKDLLQTKNILGVLVGSNDMCNYFALRRSPYQTVYDIGVVRDILTDIISIMGKDFIVNGPIWEYFDGINWEEGLRKEMELDKLNGFVGKSCVHPKQLKIITEEMKVNAYDFEDAEEILNWNSEKGVSKGKHTGRMNEVATHKSWAEKIYTLGKLYGLKGEME